MPVPNVHTLHNLQNEKIARLQIFNLRILQFFVFYLDKKKYFGLSF